MASFNLYTNMHSYNRMNPRNWTRLHPCPAATNKVLVQQFVQFKDRLILCFVPRRANDDSSGR